MKNTIAALFLLTACASAPTFAAHLSDDTIWHNYTKSGASALKDNDLEQAEALYAAALDVAKRSGKKDARLAKSLEQLADVMKKEGKFAKAEPLYVEELALQDTLGDESARDREKTLASLASVSNSEQKYAQARDYYRKLLALIEKTDGANADALFKPLHKLVLVENSLGDYASAEADCQKQKDLIAQSPVLSGSTQGFEDMAVVFREEKKFDQAAREYETAISKIKQNLGAEDLSLVPLLNHLAVCYEKTGDTASAEKNFQEALKIDKRDKNRAGEVPVMANYIQMLKNQGRLDEAKKLEESSEKIQAEDTKPTLP